MTIDAPRLPAPAAVPAITTIDRMWVGMRALSDGALHIVVVHADARRPTFYELQAVKDTLAGPERQAVEIYPPASELVDEGGNSATHLWVLPEGQSLRCTLNTGATRDRTDP